jgi:hypothetical protein
MSIIKTTLLTNIFNEEYLLPFWLNHHKNMFDEIIIIDYNSTDKSIEICKSICPECKIIKTRNAFFDAEEIDKEFMDIENTIEGVKIVLNTTEFFFSKKSIKDLFMDNTQPFSYAITCTSPYSKNSYNINNNYELFINLLNDDVVFHNDRYIRVIHTYSNGNYTVGRHSTNNNTIPTSKAHIIWLGYYPMNNNLLERKLQIQQNIPQRDKDRGFGFQHLFNKDTILNINNEKSNSGSSLKNINLPLYDLLSKKYKNKKSISE